MARADPIDVTVRIVRADEGPIAGLPVRLVLGAEKDARAPEAGSTLVTDGEGRVRRQLEARVSRRLTTLDNAFIPHRTHLIEIGLELDLLGRRALYWIELDYLRTGTLGKMSALLQGAGGRFDQALKFDAAKHAWSIPGDMSGMLLTSTGATLRRHEVVRIEADGGQRWTVDVEVMKEEFTRR